MFDGNVALDSPHAPLNTDNKSMPDLIVLFVGGIKILFALFRCFLKLCKVVCKQRRKLQHQKVDEGEIELDLEGLDSFPKTCCTIKASSSRRFRHFIATGCMLWRSLKLVIKSFTWMEMPFRCKPEGGRFQPEGERLGSTTSRALGNVGYKITHAQNPL